MRVGKILLSKIITKKNVSLFCSYKEATLSFPTDAVDNFHLLLNNALTIVLRTTFWPLWFSQVKLQHPIIYERGSLAVFLKVSFDLLIRKYYIHSSIIHLQKSPLVILKILAQFTASSCPSVIFFQ